MGSFAKNRNPHQHTSMLGITLYLPMTPRMLRHPSACISFPDLSASSVVTLVISIWAAERSFWVSATSVLASATFVCESSARLDASTTSIHASATLSSARLDASATLSSARLDASSARLDASTSLSCASSYFVLLKMADEIVSQSIFLIGTRKLPVCSGTRQNPTTLARRDWGNGARRDRGNEARRDWGNEAISGNQKGLVINHPVIVVWGFV